MSNHTPGPWTAEEAGQFYVTGPDRNEPVICDIVNRVDVEVLDFDGEDWANACLIAAAPDLLAAAREASDLLRANHYNETAREWDSADVQDVASALDLAIAKAEGK